MTIETFQQPGAVAVPAPAGGALAGYLVDYSEARQLMELTIDTPWVPDAFRPAAFIPRNERPTPQALEHARQTAVAAGAVAIVYGRSIGFEDPFQALQNVYVVGGRPGLYAAAMVAIVQAAGHDVWTEDITDTRAIVCGRRQGVEQAERVTVTMDQARRAGWDRNAKYRTEPQAMLWARAASTVCRRIAQDALKGLSRSVEEMSDEQATESPASTRTVQRAATRPALAAPAAAPPPAQQAPSAAPVAAAAPSGPPLPGEDEPPAPAVVQQAESAIEKGTWDAMNARLRAIGVNGDGQKAARLAVISRIVERTITRGGELTEAEGRRVLDNLAGAAGMRVCAEVLSWPASSRAPTGDALPAPHVPPARAPVGERAPQPRGHRRSRMGVPH